MERKKSILCTTLICILLGSRGIIAGSSNNVALGKLVTSNIAESKTYARAAARMTDGNQKTDAYPGSHSLDYTLNLTIHAERGAKTDAGGFDLDSLVIDWGEYGRHFPGSKQADGSWAPAAYKADYVHWYQIDYATASCNDWQKLHECHGRPTDEDSKLIKVERIPVTASFSEGEVKTTLKDIHLHHVTKIRIRARGAHWIGIYELSAFGRPSLSENQREDNPCGK